MAMPDMRAAIPIMRPPAPELPRAQPRAAHGCGHGDRARSNKKRGPGQECRGQIAGNNPRRLIPSDKASTAPGHEPGAQGDDDSKGKRSAPSSPPW